MSDTIRAALLFLINTLFNLYLFVLIVRVILVYIGANYFDPITQFVTKLTDFIVKPLRRFIPNAGRIEIASLLLILCLEIVKYLLIASLNFMAPNPIGLFILALADSLKLGIETFFYAILLQAILSWVQPHSAANYTLYQITSPIMRPVQRVIPPIGGIDISPIPALIGLELIIMLLIDPLMRIGAGVAFG